jgi:hypothetical protein
MEMAVESMEMVVESMEMVVESMEMAPGAIPHPGRVPEQGLLSPKSCLRQRQHSGAVEIYLEKHQFSWGFRVRGFL